MTTFQGCSGLPPTNSNAFGSPKIGTTKLVIWWCLVLCASLWNLWRIRSTKCWVLNKKMNSPRSPSMWSILPTTINLLTGWSGWSNLSPQFTSFHTPAPSFSNSSTTNSAWITLKLQALTALEWVSFSMELLRVSKSSVRGVTDSQQPTQDAPIPISNNLWQIFGIQVLTPTISTKLALLIIPVEKSKEKLFDLTKSRGLKPSKNRY